MKSTTDLPPDFETHEQLWELLAEALDDPEPGVVMTPAEWVRLRQELLPLHAAQKLAS